MKKCEIRVMGDIFTLISVLDPKEYDVTVNVGRGGEILIYPSLTEDFSLSFTSAYTMKDPPILTAAVAAACHLIKHSGLPLDEISFDFLQEKIIIFYTGDGKFAVRVPKRKLLFTKHECCASGCCIESFSVDVFEGLCLLHCDDVAFCNADKLIDIVSGEMPNVLYALAFDEKDGYVHAISCHRHLKCIPDKLHLISALLSFLEKSEITGSLDGEAFFARDLFDRVEICVDSEPLA